MSKSKIAFYVLTFFVALVLPEFAAAQKGVPVLSSISPTSTTAGTAVTITATGSNFASGAIILWNGVSQATTYVSSTKLTAVLSSTAVAAAGTDKVSIYAPGRNGGTSAPLPFTVDPAPATTTTTTTTTTTAPLAITANSVPAGTTGTAYSASLTAVGGTAPYTWSVGSGALPPGLTLSSAGAISGTPTTSGTYAFVGTVKDAASGTISYTYSAMIGAGSATTTSGISLSSISPTSAAASASGTVALTANGSGFVSGSYIQWNGTQLTTTYVSPTQLTASTWGGLSATAGTVTINVVIPGAGTTNSLSLAVTSGTGTTTTTTTTTTPLAISTASVPNGTAATAYPTTTLAATGGASPYTWSVASGSTLPAGLALSTSGALSGTPTAAATYSFSIQAKDSASATVTKAYSLTVAATTTTTTTTTTTSASLSSLCVNNTYGPCGDPYEGLGAPANQQPIAACGVTISASGNYKVSQNIGTDPTATCITVTYNVTHVNFDLGGHTITGSIMDVSGNGNTYYNGTVICNRDQSAYPQACVDIYNQITSAQARVHHIVVQNQHELNGVWAVMFEMDNPGSYAGGGTGLGMPCRADHISMTSITGTGVGNRYGGFDSQGYCNAEMDHNSIHCTGGLLNACQGMGAGIAPYAYIHDNYVQMDFVTGSQDGRGLICDQGAGVNGTCDVYNNIIYANNSRAIRYREFPPSSGQGGQWGVQHGNVYNNFIYNSQESGRLGVIHIGEDDNNLMTTAINVYNNSIELNNGNGLVVVSANGVTAFNNTFTCYGGTCGPNSLPLFTDALGYSGGGTNAYFKNNVIPAGIANGVKVCGPPGVAAYACSTAETTTATVCSTGNAVGNGGITAQTGTCP